jgi:mRNA interferase YafQ
MRTIDRASAFKRDYKREAKGQHRANWHQWMKPTTV